MASKQGRGRSWLGAGASSAFEAPELDGLTAAPFWAPAVRPDVLHTERRAPRDGELPDQLSLARLPGRTVLLRTTDGEHVWTRLPTGDLQLAASSFGEIGAPAIWVMTIPMTRGGDAQLAALARFRRGLRAAARSGDAPPVDHLPANRAYLARYLRALDGDQAGLSVRAIAEQLFGADRVARDLETPNRNLLLQARYAIRRGRALMAGGYLGLLRQ